MGSPFKGYSVGVLTMAHMSGLRPTEPPCRKSRLEDWRDTFSTSSSAFADDEFRAAVPDNCAQVCLKNINQKNRNNNLLSPKPLLFGGSLKIIADFL